MNNENDICNNKLMPPYMTPQEIQLSEKRKEKSEKFKCETVL